MSQSHSSPGAAGPLARFLFLLLLIVGAILTIFGASVSVSSFGQSLADLFETGVPDRAIYLLVGGLVLCVGGITGLVLGTRSFQRER